MERALCNEQRTLLFKVDNIIAELKNIRLLENDDIQYMEELLKEGRILKEKSNEFSSF